MPDFSLHASASLPGLEHLAVADELPADVQEVLFLYDRGAKTRMIAELLHKSCRWVQTAKRDGLQHRMGLRIHRRGGKTEEVSVDPLLLAEVDTRRVAVL